MVLPLNHKTFVNQVFRRSRKLIKLNFWTGIDENDLNLWLLNFESAEEQYLAAGLLESLIYRTNEQLKSSFNDLFQFRIPNRLKKASKEIGHNLFHELGLNSKKVKVACVEIEDKPYKSGPSIQRLTKNNPVKQENLISKSEIKDVLDTDLKLLIFLDDYCGTGGQFDDFAESIGLNGKIMDSECDIVFAPLIAHEHGIEHLKSKYPGLIVAPSEVISKKYSCFDSLVDKKNSREDIKKFYVEEIMKKKMRVNPKVNSTFGYGNLELSLFFEISSPNGSLSVFYHDNGSWKPLFKR